MAKKKNQSHDNGKTKDEVTGGSVMVVMKIDLHCEGCAAKFVKAIRSIAGVESVKRLKNDDLQKITVIGKVDPEELLQKVEKKIDRKVELLFPVAKNQKDGNGEQKKQQKQQTAAVKDVNKSVKFPVTTTVLKVSLHCKGCIEKIENLVKKTDGFMKMSIDKNNDLVMVKGGIDVNKLTTTIKDKLKKNVEIVQAKDISGGEKGKGGGGGRDDDGDRKKSSGGGLKVEGNKIEHLQYPGQYIYPQYMYPQYPQYMYPQYPQSMYLQYANGPVYTYNYPPDPLMFNDENTNACIVM